MNTPLTDDDMTDELFPTEETLSPREAWKRKHDFRTHYAEHYAEHCYEAPWSAWLPKNESEGGLPYDPELCGYGMTEEDAIFDCCRINRIPDWRTP